MGRSALTEEELRNMYIDLMKLTLTDMIYESKPKSRRRRVFGKDWPRRAFTMIGQVRLQNVQDAVEDVLLHHVPGDLVECGVWRGGATILMRALLKAYGITDRYVWVVDSFEGLPVPDLEKYPQDEHQRLHNDNRYLAVSEDRVKLHFERCGLYDRQVKFLKGWFKDTLPTAPIKKIAVLRMDGDYYESTHDILVNLYDKVSPGGWIIVDDYWAVPACRQKVHEFRTERGITAPVTKIDWASVYWIKEK